MTHLTVAEWGRAPIGERPGFSRSEADRLLAAARRVRFGDRARAGIVADHHRFLRVGPVVGVLSAGDCSLEILPKIDLPDPCNETQGEASARIRDRLIGMLDVAAGLEIGHGEAAAMARQDETLLDVLTRLFADRLADEARRGLPRLYRTEEDDLPALRGRLDATRQFTRLAARPDRLACRFDALTPDTPLLRIMKAAVAFLVPRARRAETRRRLAELRLVFEEVADTPLALLPWDAVSIDRTSRRWRALFGLARLLLGRSWQDATRGADATPDGASLLFPMNELFEAYVSVLVRRAVEPLGFEVVAQGGRRACLHRLDAAGGETPLFQTRPDLILKKAGRPVLILDAKWKRIALRDDAKQGVSQDDVYQMMAYARIYGCPRLGLLYPHHPGLGTRPGVAARHRIRGADEAELLSIASIDVSCPRAQVTGDLKTVVLEAMAGSLNG